MSDHFRHSADVKMGSERSFGLVFAAVFTIVAFWAPVWHAEPPRWWALAIAAAFLFAAFATPQLLRPLNALWFRFGMILSKVMTPVVMAILFVFAIVPANLYFRIRGRDTMLLRAPSTGQSLWQRVERQRSMKNQF